MPEGRPWDYDEEVTEGDSGGFPDEATRRSFMAGAKTPMAGGSVDTEGGSVAGKLGTVVSAALPFAAPAVAGSGAVGSLLRGGAGYLGGEVLEQMGAPGWFGEVVGMAGGGAGALKSLAKRAIGKTVEDELKKQAIKAAVGETVKTGASKVVSKEARQALTDFARANVKSKMGEKIHVLLDEAGKPLRVLTQDQAGAATRAGKNVTWIKNFWGGQ